jgi:Flp pilus assembly protein TadD
MKSRRPNETPRAAPIPATVPAAPVNRPRTTTRFARYFVPAAVLGAAAAAAVVFWSRTPPPDAPTVPDPPTASRAPLPTLTASPFRNTKPDVAYVGDDRCLSCHIDYASYHDHPMGRSLFRTERAPPPDQFDKQAGNRFRAGPFHFEVLQQGGKQVHREWCEDARGTVVAEQRVEVAYAVGSGAQGRSYLHERDGFLFESPITWYAQRAGWHLSPGYDANPMHFTRRIDARCLFCHANEAHPVEHTVNRYREPPFGQLAIGCERCHGPGALHASSTRPAPAPGAVDDTIVNPRHLSAPLRDAICEQCHLQGEGTVPRRGRSQTEYRPGLPLHEYALTFVRPPELQEPTAIVGHAEQMRQSACSVKSAGRFGCTSCHDPHRAPPAAGAVNFYQGRCRGCHTPDHGTAPDCSLPPARRVAPDGRADCLVCHMPRNPSVTNRHLAVTDHRLLRRPDQSRSFRSGYRPGNLPLLPFHQNQLAADDPDVSRDLAVAAVDLASQARRDGAVPVSDFLIRGALPLLARATARDADDVLARESYGYALVDQRRPDEALRVLDEVLARAPDREQALVWAGDAALMLGRLDSAEAYYRRSAEKYPHYPAHHERLAAVLVKRQAWAEAVAAARTAVRGNPFRASAREVLITALIETGDVAGARAEFEVVGVLDPAYQTKLRERFGPRLGSPK